MLDARLSSFIAAKELLDIYFGERETPENTKHEPYETFGRGACGRCVLPCGRGLLRREHRPDPETCGRRIADPLRAPPRARTRTARLCSSSTARSAACG